MQTETERVDLVGEQAARNVARTVVFAAATAATAPVTITHPVVPNVPITLQTLWVYLAGLVLGPLWGAAAFVVYLVSGAIGLPVFAGGTAGVGVLTSPTGGYLVGFVAGAFAVGAVAHATVRLHDPRTVGALPALAATVRDSGVVLRDPRDLGLARAVVALVAGSAVVYAGGVLGLMVNADLGLRTAIEVGVLPFLAVAAVKIAAAVGIVNADAVPWGEAVTR